MAPRRVSTDDDKWRGPSDGVNSGSDYSDEEREFLMAMDRWKLAHHNFPSWCEVLEVFKSLGYRRILGEDLAGGAK